MAGNTEGIDNDPSTHDFPKSRPQLTPDRSDWPLAGTSPSTSVRPGDDVVRAEVGVGDASGTFRKDTNAGSGPSKRNNGEGSLTP